MKTAKLMRGQLAWGCALVVVTAAGCRLGCTKDKNVSDPPAVAIAESAAAKGANRMRLSADGRWMMLEYEVEDELPLLVRIDRRGGSAPVVVRGVLAGPPREDGTVFYVEQEVVGWHEVLATSARKYRSYLRRLGVAERLISLDGQYGAWPVDDDTVVMIGGPGDQCHVLRVNAADGDVRVRSEPLVGLGYLASIARDSERIFLLFDPYWNESGPVRTDGLILVALSIKDLRPLWRREKIAPAIIFTRQSLGVGMERVFIISQTSPLMPTFDAATGTPGPVLRLPPGGNLRFVPMAKPAAHTLLLWKTPHSVVSDDRGWRLVRVRGDVVDTVIDRPDDLHPRAAVWDGDKVLLAPYAIPRWSDHPESWEAPFVDYLKLLDRDGH